IARAIERERSRASRTHAGDEVGLVDEEVSGSLTLTESRIQKRQRRCLASEDWCLVDLVGAQRNTDLRARAHAFGGAVNRDFALAAARYEFHFHSRRFTGAQLKTGRILSGEARHRDRDLVLTSQRQRRDCSCSFLARDRFTRS